MEHKKSAHRWESFISSPIAVSLSAVSRILTIWVIILPPSSSLVSYNFLSKYNLPDKLARSWIVFSAGHVALAVDYCFMYFISESSNAKFMIALTLLSFCVQSISEIIVSDVTLLWFNVLFWNLFQWDKKKVWKR